MASIPSDKIRKFTLTDKGEEFIRFVCKGESNGLLVGRNNFNLPYSTDSSTTNFVASPTTDKIKVPTKKIC